MIRYLQTRYHEAVEQSRLRTAQFTLAQKAIERKNLIQSRIVAEAGLLGSDDGPYFDLLNYKTADAMDESALQELQRRMFKLYTVHPLAHGWIDLFVRFIVGDEFQLRSLDSDPRTQEVWDEFAYKNDFPLRAVETVQRTLMMGECFTRKFVNEINGDMTTRFMEPLQVRNPYARQMFDANSVSFGIQTDPDDIEKVIRYWYDPNQNGQFVSIPADEVLHTKIGQCGMKRGRPLLLACLEYLLELEKILKARRIMHQVRCSCAIEERIDETSPEYVNAIIRADETTNGGETKRALPQIGAIQTVGGGVTREYKTPNLQSQDGDADIRRVMLCMATALGIAEYMATSDASQGNYANTRETTYPTIRTFEGWQRFFGISTFEKLGAAVIRAKIAAGELQETSFKTVTTASNGIISKSTERVPRNLRFTADYPLLQIRDVKLHTDALMLQSQQGWVSDRQAIIELGRNADETKTEVMAERQEKEKEMDATDESDADRQLAAMNRLTPAGNGNRRD